MQEEGSTVFLASSLVRLRRRAEVGSNFTSTIFPTALPRLEFLKIYKKLKDGPGSQRVGTNLHRPGNPVPLAKLSTIQFSHHQIPEFPAAIFITVSLWESELLNVSPQFKAIQHIPAGLGHQSPCHSNLLIQNF